jgi:phospholipid/cholesterol/gamma-HCH transport system permease protein
MPAYSAESKPSPSGPGITLRQVEAGTLLLSLTGNWKLKGGLPTAAAVAKQLGQADHLRRLHFDAAELGSWDSGLLAFLVALQDSCQRRGVEFDAADLPQGARRLLRLATAVPERQGARRTDERPDFLTLVGGESLTLWRSGGEMLEFIGEALQSFGQLLIGRARFRRSDLVDVIFECGAAALPIVTLISFLVGLILAFVGAVQRPDLCRRSGGHRHGP